MSCRRLYIFNPDHDLALANGNENFFPPSLARSFTFDGGCLPLWYALPGSVVTTPQPDESWLRNVRNSFPQLRDISLDPHTDFSSIDKICPWGWNSAIRKRLLSEGVPANQMPDGDCLAHIRRLSHRSTAIEALKFLHDNKELTHFLPQPGQQLTFDEVTDFAKTYSRTVFKAPWSGSGKGLFWINGSFSKNAIEWCQRITEKQGSIVGEKAYDKLLDFAMEFECSENTVSFIGYSLFETENQGIYRSNRLLSDEAIVEIITYFISEDFLLKVQQQLSLFIEKSIAPFYSGFLGVDMLIYKDGNRFCLHPCVEINLRMTMGLVARTFFYQFVHPQSQGYFYADYFHSSAKLVSDHLQRQQEKLLITNNGKIVSGYISLSPVTMNTNYRIRIEIMK
jgi:hypothetical protein